MIDAYCSYDSYLHHLTPILNALPDDLRGNIYGPREMQRAHRGVVHATATMPRSTHPLLVAGATDLIHAKRPKVLVAHGAEQTYVGVDRAEYCGGPGRELVDLFIGPRWESVYRDMARYPDARGIAVGCPKLDRWATIPKPRNEKPVVAVAFHWDCKVAPEAGTAFRHFAPALPELAKRYAVLGHAHPRAWDMVAATYHAAGIEIVRSAEELLARADVLVCDNSSLMYEWAAMDRPVVALNAPEWRRDVEHGLRFWSQVPGGQVSDPADLVKLVAYYSPIEIEPFRQMRRAEVTDFVYGGMVDGHASERAACAVLDLIGAPCKT